MRSPPFAPEIRIRDSSGTRHRSRCGFPPRPPPRGGAAASPPVPPQGGARSRRGFATSPRAHGDLRRPPDTLVPWRARPVPHGGARPVPRPCRYAAAQKSGGPGLPARPPRFLRAAVRRPARPRLRAGRAVACAREWPPTASACAPRRAVRGTGLAAPWCTWPRVGGAAVDAVSPPVPPRGGELRFPPPSPPSGGANRPLRAHHPFSPGLDNPRREEYTPLQWR